MSRVSRMLALPIAITVPALVVTGCSSSTSGGSSSDVAVTAKDDSCKVARNALDAGSTTFKVKNGGSKVTEVYVYGLNGDEYTKVVSEVENIGPGTSRDMTVTLSAGTYEIACKPGQTGNGIRTKITVAGAVTGTPTTSASEAAYDREIEFETDGSALTGGASTAAKGEKIEFKLENKATGTRNFEIKKPDGSVAGEVEIATGTTGELIVELDAAGAWQIIVEGGADDIVRTLTVS